MSALQACRHTPATYTCMRCCCVYCPACIAHENHRFCLPQRITSTTTTAMTTTTPMASSATRALASASPCHPCDAILHRRLSFIPAVSYDELKPGAVFSGRDIFGRVRIVKVLPAIDDAAVLGLKQHSLRPEAFSGIRDFDLLAPQSYDLEHMRFAAFPTCLCKWLLEALIQRYIYNPVRPFSVRLEAAGLIFADATAPSAATTATLGWLTTSFGGVDMWQWLRRLWNDDARLGVWAKIFVTLRALRGALRQIAELHRAGVVHNDLNQTNIVTDHPLEATIQTAAGAVAEFLTGAPSSIVTHDAIYAQVDRVADAIPDSSWRIIDFGRATLLGATTREWHISFRGLFTGEQWAANSMDSDDGDGDTTTAADSKIKSNPDWQSGLEAERLLLMTLITEREGQLGLETDILAGAPPLPYTLHSFRRQVLNSPNFHRNLYSVDAKVHVRNTTATVVGPIVDVIYFVNTFVQRFFELMHDLGLDKFQTIKLRQPMAQDISRALLENRELYRLDEPVVQKTCETQFRLVWATLKRQLAGQYP